MARIRFILLSTLFAIALSGCVTAAASLAVTAVNLVSGGGGKDSPFRNPIDRHTTGRQVRDALSRLDDQVDPACQQLLEEHKQVAETGRSAAAVPDETPGGDSDAAGTAVASDAGSVDPAGSEAVAAVTAEPQGPGQCRHQLVCLPGTPQPTMMLMCPGKGGAGQDEDKTIASADETVVPSGAAGETPPANLTPEKTDGKFAPAPQGPPPPEGGLADWSWSQDPVKRH